MHCRVPAGTFATLLLGLLACPSRAEELPPPNRALEPVYQKLKTLFQRYYPEAVSHLRGDKIHFEHNTRFFTVQTFRKDGGWQDPRQEQGPNPGGVLCELLFGTGIYAGATSAPHSFKRPEYEILFLAPDSLCGSARFQRAHFGFQPKWGLRRLEAVGCTLEGCAPGRLP